MMASIGGPKYLSTATLAEKVSISRINVTIITKFSVQLPVLSLSKPASEGL
jgi:hypothetical protein